MDTKTKISRLTFIGFAFTVIAGSLLRFAFAASEGNTLIGAFAPVNGSVWENLKLIIFPGLLFAVPEFLIYGRCIPNFTASRISSLFSGALLYVFLTYAYVGMTGSSFYLADAFIFIFSVGLAYLVGYFMMKSSKCFPSDNYTILFIILATAMIILFFYYTFNPPMSELFRDPITEDFGIINTFN